MAERYVEYKTSVTAGAPNTHTVFADLNNRPCKSGSLVHDTAAPAGDLLVRIDGDSDLITIKPGEILRLTGAEVGTVVVDASAGTLDYRLLATVWDIV